MPNTTSPAPLRLTRAQVRTIAGATIGAVLEWFDLLVYAMFAVVLAKQFFPTSRPVGLAAAQPRHLCAGLAGAPDRRRGDRRLCRPRRPQARADPVRRPDDGRHAADRPAAALLRHRPGRAAADDAGAAAAGLLGRRRVRQRHRPAGRAGPGPPRLLRQPAMVRIGLRGVPGRGFGLRHQLAADARSGRRLGLAAAVPVRPADRPGRLVHPQPRRGNAGVPRHRDGQRTRWPRSRRRTSCACCWAPAWSRPVPPAATPSTTCRPSPRPSCTWARPPR